MSADVSEPDPGSARPALELANSDPYTSVRGRPIPREQRRYLGKALRRQTPRSVLGDFDPPADRQDVVEQIERIHEGRLDRLVPLRVGRMAESPYGFLRGAAGIMAQDLARLPATGITPVISGDAHFGNFGFYASPERQLVLDINDFDEAHPGSWEWDLRRLSASVWLSGREHGADEADCEEAVAACSAAYRDQLRELFEQPLLDRSFLRLDKKQLMSLATTKSLRKRIKKASHRARGRTSDRALPRFTEDHGADRRIVEEPPLLTRLDEQEREAVAESVDRYLLTLAPHWRRVVGGYTLIDVAHKVVGVGSVGLRA